MSTVIESLEQRELRKRPNFGAGDRVRVHFQVVEGTRKRTQVFEGIVLKRQGSGARETFTVRKHSFGVGVERTFPLHSPKIEELEVAARGDVKRAKLYYLRDKVGKQARVAERRWGIEDELIIAEPEAEAVDAEGVAIGEAETEVVDAETAEGTEAPEATEAEAEGTDAPEAAEAGQSEPPAEAAKTPAEATEAAEAEEGAVAAADGGGAPAEDAAASPQDTEEAAPEGEGTAPEADESASSKKAEG